MIGQLLQKTCLKLVNLNLEAIKLLDELLFLFREIRSFFPDDKGEKLILETRLGYREVDECCLSLNFRWIVRALELGMHVEIEVRAE